MRAALAYEDIRRRLRGAAEGKGIAGPAVKPAPRKAPRFPIPPGSLAAVAAAAKNEAILEQLFEQRAEIHREELYSDLQETVDLIEYAILGSDAPSPRLAEMRLWIALSHSVNAPGELYDATIDGDLAPFRAGYAALDFDIKFIVGAIAALRGETIHG